jgi:paraquat-inducible protein B
MSKARPIVVGVFVLGAIALLVAGILFFSAGTLTARHVRTVAFFPGTVAGLQVGSTVTFLGVPVGQVTSMGVRVTADINRPIIQVNMELVPDRLAVYGASQLGETEMVPTLVQRGLAAQLVKESFITGRLTVELAFRPGVQTSVVGGTDDPELPTVPADFAALTKQLQAVDIAGAVESFQHAVTSLDGLLNDRDLRQALHEAPAVMGALRRTLTTVDRQVVALSRSAQGALGGSAAALQKTLSSVQTLTADLDRESTITLTAMRGTLGRADSSIDHTRALLDPQGPMATQLQQAADDLAATAARLRNVAERVDRDPSVLVRGR